jgi:hypothetical protein
MADMNPFLSMGGLGSLFGGGKGGGGLDIQGMLGLKPFHEQLKTGGFIGSLLNGSGLLGGDQKQQPQDGANPMAAPNPNDESMRRLIDLLSRQQQPRIGGPV